MKMLVVAPHPFFTPRGTPLSVYYRTLVTSELGVSIDLLTYGSGKDVHLPGVRVVRIPRVGWLEPVPVGPSWTKLLLDVFMVVWTVGLLLRHRYQVVHAHEEAVFWCRMLKPIFHFRLVYDMHSSLPQQLENFRFTRLRFPVRIFAALESNCLHAADAVITICPDLRDLALKSGVAADRHFLIENSIFENVRVVDPAGGAVVASELQNSLQPDPAYPTILYAGTFESYQGVELLIQAFAIVGQTVEARLLLAGGTPEQVERMRRAAESAGIADACRFLGQVPKSEAMRLTQAATILVSPRTHGSNTPLKIYEQIASGIPLVATRIWSHTQVLDEDVCILVEPEPKAMAKGIVSALDDPHMAGGRAARAKVLYASKYARPVYVGKMRRLLSIVGVDPMTEVTEP